MLQTTKVLCKNNELYLISHAHPLKKTTYRRHTRSNSLTKNIRTSKCRIRPNFQQNAKNIEGQRPELFLTTSELLSQSGTLSNISPKVEKGC